MRDPDGTIEFYGERVIRNIHQNSLAKPFLNSESASNLVSAGKVIPYEFTAPGTIESARVPMITYPFEWCDAQIFAAAQLTLEISCEILRAGHELKDASAWNVIFDGSQPLFCDYLSFQPIIMPTWWAFGQYTRHFTLPLAVSQHCGLKPNQIFSTYLDGISPESARKILGPRRYLTRLLADEVSSKSQFHQLPSTSTRRPLHEGLIVSVDHAQWFTV